MKETIMNHKKMIDWILIGKIKIINPFAKKITINLRENCSKLKIEG